MLVNQARRPTLALHPANQAVLSAGSSLPTVRSLFWSQSCTQAAQLWASSGSVWVSWMVHWVGLAGRVLGQRGNPS